MVSKNWKWILANKEAINKLLESQILFVSQLLLSIYNSPTGGLPIHYRAPEELANRGHKVTVIFADRFNAPTGKVDKN